MGKSALQKGISDLSERFLRPTGDTQKALEEACNARKKREEVVERIVKSVASWQQDYHSIHPYEMYSEHAHLLIDDHGSRTFEHLFQAIAARDPDRYHWKTVAQVTDSEVNHGMVYMRGTLVSPWALSFSPSPLTPFEDLTQTFVPQVDFQTGRI